MTSKGTLSAVNKRRDLLIESLRVHLLPAFVKQGFEIAPLVHRGPVDDEFVRRLPLGRLRRAGRERVDLVEIDLARHSRPAFRIMAGVAPRGGLNTANGRWAAEDVYVPWLNEFFVMYACPRLRAYFSLWFWRFRTPTLSEYDKLVSKVVTFLPEIEVAFREGKLERHMRRVVIPRQPVSATLAGPPT
jgi:hypothetical protein